MYSTYNNNIIKDIASNVNTHP